MCMTQYFQGNAVFCLQQLSAQSVVTILLWNRTIADFFFIFIFNSKEFESQVRQYGICVMLAVENTHKLLAYSYQTQGHYIMSSCT